MAHPAWCRRMREAVDLTGGFIVVKTSKTGEFVQIPIFPRMCPTERLTGCR